MENEKNDMNYPLYFRKAGRCIRQDGPTQTWTIGLPPEFKVPVRFPTEYPSAQHLQDYLKDFEVVDAAKFKEFVTTFYMAVGEERSQHQQYVLKGIATGSNQNP